ncbi:MAG: methyltransferase domain-containing protein [Chitinophagales bacterium]
MIDWSHRHPGPELMDRDDLPAEHLFQNYRELHVINKWLGGYRIMLKGLSSLITDHNTEFSILDVGCGGGNMINEISKWGKRNNFSLRITGIDLTEAAIDFSRQNEIDHNNWIRGDVFKHLKSGVKYDVITSTLFMHHFPDEKIKELLSLMMQSCRVGVVINDLQRHRLAYRSIQFLTTLFSKSYLVKNDAPLSVLRSFRKDEWRNIFEKSGITSPQVQWRWAFRYLIVIRK